MDLSGEERKLQASFLEFALEDKKLAPRFSDTLNRVRLKRRTPFRGLASAVIVITVLVVGLSFALRKRASHGAKVPTGSEENVIAAVAPTLEQVVVKETMIVRKKSLRRVTTHRQQVKSSIQETDMRQLVALSNWKSPTSGLLASPGGELLFRLPRLNQPVHDLKAFLSSEPN